MAAGCGKYQEVASKQECLVAVNALRGSVYAKVMDASHGFVPGGCSLAVNDPSAEWLYFSQNGNMYAIDALNGSVIWSYHAGLDWVVDGDHIASSPALSYDDGAYLSTAGKIDNDLYTGHQLFFGAEDAHLYALQLLTGDVTWSFLTSGPIRATPTLSDGMVYAGSTDGRLYKLQADTGRLVWSYGFGSMNVSLGMSHAYRDWSLKALLHVNGTNQSGWREPYGFREDGTQAGAGAIGRGLDASVHKERSAGWMGWREPASTERWFSSENLTEFSQRWWENATANATVPGDVYGSPVVDDAAQAVYVGTRDRKLYALDVEDGAVLWSYATDGFLDSTPLVYSHEGSAQVFVGSFDGHVYAFGPDAPLPPRPSPPPSPAPPPPFSSPPPYIRKLRRSPRHYHRSCRTRSGRGCSPHVAPGVAARPCAGHAGRGCRGTRSR